MGKPCIEHRVPGHIDFVVFIFHGTMQAGDAVEVDGDGTPHAVPKTIILTQAINHATEHRAQIMAILTQLGIEPPSLDSWTYFDELER